MLSWVCCHIRMNPDQDNVPIKDSFCCCVVPNISVNLSLKTSVVIAIRAVTHVLCG